MIFDPISRSSLALAISISASNTPFRSRDVFVKFDPETGSNIVERKHRKCHKSMKDAKICTDLVRPFQVKISTSLGDLRKYLDSFSANVLSIKAYLMMSASMRKSISAWLVLKAGRV